MLLTLVLKIFRNCFRCHALSVARSSRPNCPLLVTFANRSLSTTSGAVSARGALDLLHTEVGGSYVASPLVSIKSGPM